MCVAGWVICAGQLAAQEAPPPRPRPPAPDEVFTPEEAPPPNGYPMAPQGGVTPTTIVPNSGYSGGDSQWDHQKYVGESPTYQEPEGCVGGGCRDSAFTPLALTSQGVALLSRGQPRSRDITTDVFLTPSYIKYDAIRDKLITQAFSASDLRFQMAPGYDALVERYLGRDANNYDWYVQGGFRGLNDWVATATVTAHTIDPITLLPSHTREINAHYGSDFNSAEINAVLRPHPRSDRIVLYPNGEWHRESQPGTYWSFLAGVRYVNIDEAMTLLGYTDGHLSHKYFAHSHNELFGLNFGTEVTFRKQGWDLGLHFKASPMINTAIADRNDEGTANRFVGTNVAAILEVGVLSTYRLSEALAVRAGYDIFWLTGGAFAPLQRPSADQVDASGTVFFQGLILGMEYRR
jgi:hypothetical protein